MSDEDQPAAIIGGKSTIHPSTSNASYPTRSTRSSRPSVSHKNEHENSSSEQDDDEEQLVKDIVAPLVAQEEAQNTSVLNNNDKEDEVEFDLNEGYMENDISTIGGGKIESLADIKSELEARTSKQANESTTIDETSQSSRKLAVNGSKSRTSLKKGKKCSKKEKTK